MVTIQRVYFTTSIPKLGIEITPSVLVRRVDDNSTFTDDVPESAPINGCFLRYKWYRRDNKDPNCSVHPTVRAILQCLACKKSKIHVADSYHCSPKCFSDAWPYHCTLHEHLASAANETEEEISGRLNSTGSGVVNTSLASSQSSSNLSHGTITLYPAIVTQRNGGETWFEVGQSKTYTPAAHDIGHVLKFECVVVGAETKLEDGPASSALTSEVIPPPAPTPRRLISVKGVDNPGHLNIDVRGTSLGTFTVLSYNILSDAYATSELYSYCPSWALSWTYRRENLLREIVGYGADIVCLQEVHCNIRRKCIVSNFVD